MVRLCILLLLAMGPAFAEPAHAQSPDRARPGVRWVAEGLIVRQLTGDRYPGDRTFLSLEVGALWQYHELASIGVVGRGALSIRKENNTCGGRQGCVIEHSNLPAALEVRFRRALPAGLGVHLGVGRILDYSGGLTTHIGLDLGEAFAVGLHGDLYQDEFHWLVGAGFHGRYGLAAFGIGYALRLFAGFADS